MISTAGRLRPPPDEEPAFRNGRPTGGRIQHSDLKGDCGHQFYGAIQINTAPADVSANQATRPNGDAPASFPRDGPRGRDFDRFHGGDHLRHCVHVVDSHDRRPATAMATPAVASAVRRSASVDGRRRGDFREAPPPGYRGRTRSNPRDLSCIGDLR
jgi:hypothetical protein